MILITMVNGVYKPIYNLGGHHIVGFCGDSIGFSAIWWETSGIRWDLVRYNADLLGFSGI